MFKTKALQLLIIESAPGLGKTAEIQGALKDTEHYLMASHVTPLQNYIELYQHRNMPICYEDVTQLLASKVNLSILKQLCETRAVKELHYHSTSQKLTVPPKFETTSNVLVTVNEIKEGNTAIQALLSRGLLVRFQPTKEEILGKMRQIVGAIDVVSLSAEERQEALGFVISNAKFAQFLNLRHLVKCLQFFEFSKTHEFDWQANSLRLMGVDSKSKEIYDLVQSGKPIKEQVKSYSGNRSEYFKRKKEMIK